MWLIFTIINMIIIGVIVIIKKKNSNDTASEPCAKNRGQMKLHKCLKKLPPGRSAVCQQFPFLGPPTLKEGLKLLSGLTLPPMWQMT